MFTPKNTKNNLLKFKYKGNEYVGEMLKSFGNSYMIRMEDKDGGNLKILVKKKDIVK